MKLFTSYAILSLALLLSGCSSDSEDTGCTASSCGEGTVCDAEDGRASSTTASECIDDSECSNAQVCRNNECVDRCAGVDCPGSQVLTRTLASGSTVVQVAAVMLAYLMKTVGSTASVYRWGMFGRAFADCSQIECKEGLNCAAGVIGSQCLVPCTEASECELIEQCLTQPPVFLAGFRNHCFPNLCGPFDEWEANDIRRNILSDAAYLGPCPVSGDPDGGICWGEFDLNAALGRGGICMGGTGTKLHGESCDPSASHGNPDSCLNAFCAPQTNTCMDFCNIFDDEACPTGSACLVVPDPPGHDRAGVCAPAQATPAAALEACTPSDLGINPCVNGTFCAPRDVQEGSETVCLPACLITPDEDGTGACEAGTCTAVQSSSQKDLVSAKNKLLKARQRDWTLSLTLWRAH